MTESRMTKLKCPKCGSSLNTDGEVFWCSFVACDFGIKEVVPVADVLQPYFERFHASSLEARSMDYATAVELELFVIEPLLMTEYRKWLLMNDVWFHGLIKQFTEAGVVDENRQNLLYAVIIAREHRRLSKEIAEIRQSSNVGANL